MHNHTPILNDVLTGLEEVMARQLPPDAASLHFQRIAERHPGAAIELVWEDQAFDNSLHYDALIRPAGAARTISMSVCPDDALPWALRGLQRWRDSELLRVNNIVMEVGDAIAQLDMLWQSSASMQRLIDSCIIEGELQRRDVQVGPAEVQVTLDNMRRRRGLLTAAQLKTWLADTGMTLNALQDMALKIARANRLRDVIVGAEAANYFEAHRSAFDGIKLSVLQVETLAAAEEIAARVRRQAVPLMEVAHRLLVSNASTQFSFRSEARHALQAEFQVDALTVESVHVVAGEQACLVLEVLAVEPALTNPATAQAVKAKLFQDWLAEQRRTARIDWFWGDAQRTAPSEFLRSAERAGEGESGAVTFP
jgi:putative peptide maturation system protein